MLLKSLITALLAFVISPLPQAAPPSGAKATQAETPVPLPRTTPPTKAELAAITERGRLLAGYDVAAWHASDAVQAEKLDARLAGRYVAHKTAKGWVVDFGRLSPQKDSFLIAATATQGATPETFTVQTFDPPKSVIEFPFIAARSLETALNDFRLRPRPEGRSYNVAVLPAPSNQVFVYMYPAQTQNGVYPLGGDVRYTVSGDGAKIVARRQMHNAIIDFASPKGKAIPAAGFHTIVVDNIPQDTDVFFVLSRKPALPEYVGTAKFIYLIQPNGTILYQGPMEKFKGGPKKP